MSAGVKPAFAARPGVILDQAAAELFERTFREGMDLIAEVSAYLDGIGRLESRRLSREAAADYAAESMRLTTRLMQVASWLMVQRSVREGETRPEAAGFAASSTSTYICRSIRLTRSKRRSARRENAARVSGIRGESRGAFG